MSDQQGGPLTGRCNFYNLPSRQVSLDSQVGYGIILKSNYFFVVA
jgi:hypothetical protein